MKKVTLLFISTCFLAFSCTDNKKTRKHETITAAQVIVKETTTTQETFTVHPIFPKAVTSFKTYTIQADKEQVIEHKSGSKIKIPKDAFTDAQGNAVYGNIKIKYREFQNAYDIFLSGIPMHYEDKENSLQLESAGMFEIEAFSGNQQLQLKKEKQIEVELISKMRDDNFNLYFLDTVAKKWDLRAQKLVPEKVKSIAPDLTDQVQNKTRGTVILCIDWVTKAERLENLNLNPTTPAIPVMTSDSKYHFDVKIDLSNDDQYRYYSSDVIWEYAGSNPSSDPMKNKYFEQREWESYTLYDKDTSGRFYVKFKNQDTSFQTIMRPTFKKSDYKKAFASYIKASRNYKTFMAAEQLRTEEEKQIQKTQQRVVSTNDMVYRSFAITQMGIWNCDRPMGLPKGAVVNAKYTNQKGEVIQFNTVYLIDKAYNTVFKYYPNVPVQFNPQSHNTLFAVTADGKLAVFRNNDFKELKTKSQSESIPTQTFTMTVLEEEFESPEKIKEVLAKL